MSSSRLERLAPLTGVVFAVIFYVTVVGGGDTPDADASAVKAVRYWSDNDSKQVAVSIAIVIAVVFFVWFAGTLRSRLLEAEGGTGRLATTVYGGAILFAAGALASAGLNFTVADTAGDLSPAATQTLSALSSDFFFPMVGGGALLYLATAVATLRTGALPRWLGWASLALGVICLTPVGWVPFLLLGLWTVVIAVIMYRAQAPAPQRSPRPSPPASAPAT